VQSHIWGRASKHTRKCRNIFTIYEEVVSHIWLCTRSLWISYYVSKIYFLFCQCRGREASPLPPQAASLGTPVSLACPAPLPLGRQEGRRSMRALFHRRGGHKWLPGRELRRPRPQLQQLLIQPSLTLLYLTSIFFRCLKKYLLHPRNNFFKLLFLMGACLIIHAFP
jgi:hypothetical protein